MYRILLRETVLGFVFWSLFQGLGPMIWFYPLNELELSGYEVFVVFWFMPIILGVGFINSFLQYRIPLAILRLITWASLASFQAPSTLQRLVILAIGAGTSLLVFSLSIWSSSKHQRCVTFWGLITGFFAMLAGRIWLTSFIPTWWSNQSNSIVTALALIATLDKIITGDDSKGEVKEFPKGPWYNFIPVGFGMGSLLYLTHWVFGEVSLVSRWTVTGYPDHGPVPYHSGIAVLLALGVGSLFIPKCAAKSKLWFLFGAGSFLCLYYLPTWQGFAGGLCLAIFTMSLWPEMMERLPACYPGSTMVMAMLVYLVEIFFLVWTVAYNFVPGGIYTREHTDYLIAAVLFGIFLGIFVGKKSHDSGYAISYPSAEKYEKIPKTAKIYIFLIVLIGLGGFASRCQHQQFEHKTEHPNEFSALIWTYHFGYDNQGWPSLERSLKLLNETGADFITLLESDASKPFLGNNDLGMWLGEKLGMYVDFGVATKDHTWGNLILSKYPIVKSKHHLLPSPHGELAPAITATINFNGKHVDFVVTHMGNDRDVIDREQQAIFLSDELKKCKNPAVFLGYVTSAPGSRDYKRLINYGGVKDIDSTDKGRWCEYIMYKGLIRLGYARITHGGLSDTEVQMAKFRIPDSNNFKDNSKIEKDPKKIEKRLHFNPRFGSYRSGHFSSPDHQFHMDTPKYFV